MAISARVAKRRELEGARGREEREERAELVAQEPYRAVTRPPTLASAATARAVTFLRAAGGYARLVQLVKWKRNEIIKAVVAGGLDKRDCTFDFGDSESRITLPPSESSFLIEGDAGNYTSTMIVGDGLPQPLRHYTWPTVVDRCQRWAAEVKRDVETPDLWAELQRERELLTDARYADVENTPFTPDERAEVAERLGELRQAARVTYSLSDAQLRSLNERLDYLEEAAGRLGRTDWRGLFVGVLLSTFVAGLLPPEAVHDVFVTALHGLEHLFGGGVVPLAPGQLPPVT